MNGNKSAPSWNGYTPWGGTWFNIPVLLLAAAIIPRLIFFLLAIPGGFLMFAGFQQGGGAAIAGAAIAVVYWLILGVISSAVQGIFVAALYCYATTKEVPPGFSSDAFRNAWQPKR